MELKTKGKLGKSSGDTETANAIYKRTFINFYIKGTDYFLTTKYYDKKTIFF
jgi:hypothetical protein